MAEITDERMIELLQPYFAEIGEHRKLVSQLRTYLELLFRWNERTNLTAVRDQPAAIQRHFGESLFAGLILRQRIPGARTLLDFGSGAGFPGLPIQLFWPELQVTLAESQGKKAAFLREVVRTLGLDTEIWAGRVEQMPVERRFDIVTLRAVDHMQQMMPHAEARVLPGGSMAVLGGTDVGSNLPYMRQVAVPGLKNGHLWHT